MNFLQFTNVYFEAVSNWKLQWKLHEKSWIPVFWFEKIILKKFILGTIKFKFIKEISSNFEFWTWTKVSFDSQWNCFWFLEEISNYYQKFKHFGLEKLFVKLDAVNLQILIVNESAFSHSKFWHFKKQKLMKFLRRIWSKIALNNQKVLKSCSFSGIENWN